MVKTPRPFFKAGWLLTGLTFAAVALFLALGAWQLRRAEEKQALLDLQQRQLQRPAIRLQGEETLAELGRYRKVIVTGIWDPDHQILLDSRTYRGKVGYEVLTPLETGGGKVILINRGWVPLGGTRERLPDITIERKKVTIRGRTDRFPRMGMQLQGMREPSPGWPSVVQELVPEVLAGRMKKHVLDFQIKMDEDLPDGYVRQWRLDYIKPERHIGYALQWFIFAAIALGLWLWFGFKRARENVTGD